MSYKHWKLQVYEWRKRWPAKPVVKGVFDPTRTKILAAACAYCGSRVKVHRHHKGHEFVFACIMPERYAERYIQFHPEDTVPLCRVHHRYIHKKYQRIIVDLNIVISLYEPYRLSFETLEAFRLQIVAICDKWLAKRQRNLTGKLQEKR